MNDSKKWNKNLPKDDKWVGKGMKDDEEKDKWM